MASAKKTLLCIIAIFAVVFLLYKRGLLSSWTSTLTERFSGAYDPSTRIGQPHVGPVLEDYSGKGVHNTGDFHSKKEEFCGACM